MKFDILLAYPKPSNVSHLKLTPLSILFPGVFFTEKGLSVAYYDERFDSPEMLDELIKASREIGVSAFTGYQTGQAAAILKRAKAINPAIITGVGGHHARILPGEVLAEPFVDKVWTEKSYGENIFPYNEQTKIHFQRTDLMYQTSRGCPFPCRFCTLSSRWEPKEIKLLERELKTLHNDIGFKDVFFCDPNIAFASNEENRITRIKQLGRIMKELNVNWNGNLRNPYLTPRFVDTLVEANCTLLEVGCESGNDYFLKRIIKKGHGVNAIKQGVMNVKDSGLTVMYSFMAFMPRETSEMLNDTLDLIDWIIANNSKARVSIYNYTPYPGTPMYEDAVAGVDGYPKFIPPKTMEEWAKLPLMASPIYWIAGLCFRQDNTRKNFPGDDWELIRPYVELAQKKWKERDVRDFPCAELEMLISKQVEKYRK